MSKSFVDQLIRNMKLAGIVTKASPWMMEGKFISVLDKSNEDKAMNVRYVGIKMEGDWLEIFSEKDNLLLKFVITRSTSLLEFYLANSTPFVRISFTRFSEKDKWETMLGELRRKLMKDKVEFMNHKEGIGNLYELIKPHLKK